MTFGDNLKYYRTEKGYSLQDLAEKLDVSANYLSKLERNSGKVKPEFLPALCGALDITLNDLYKEIEGNPFKTKTNAEHEINGEKLKEKNT